MHFRSSERVSLGIEWELALVDPASGELAGRATALLDGVNDPNVRPGFFTNTIELVTKIHRNVPGAIADLRALRDKVGASAAEVGTGIIGTGTHPYSDWHVQAVTPKDRYLAMTDRTLDWGRQLSTWSLDVHVGIPSEDAVIPVMNALLSNGHWILAPSAGSPYWLGKNTGFVSHRTMIMRQVPTGGLPPDLETWDDYVSTVMGKQRAGVVQDLSSLRWDVRPQPELGTIEVRIADSPPSLFNVGASVALIQCIAEEALRAIEDGRKPDRLPSWVISENKFRASRFGFDTNFISDAEGNTAPARQAFAKRIDELQPIARDLGCEGELISNLVIVDNTPADRQRAMLRGGNQTNLIDTLRAEFLR